MWLIDFAKSKLKDHNMRDIAKLESCLIFEYTHITESTLDAAIEITDSLASMTDLRRAPRRPKRLFSNATVGRNEELAPLRMLWKNVVLLREIAGEYAQTNPTALQYHIASLSFALRCVRYRDITDLQKRWALRAAMSYAHVFSHCLNKNGKGLTLPSLFAKSSTPDFHPTTSSSTTEMAITKRVSSSDTISSIGSSGLDPFDAKQYCLYMIRTHMFTADPFTQSSSSLLDQLISITRVPSDQRRYVVCEKEFYDRASRLLIRKERSRKHLRLRGVLNFRRSSDKIYLNDNDALIHMAGPISNVRDNALHEIIELVLGHRGDMTRQILICGAATSGKTCFMKRLAVMTAEERRIIPLYISLAELSRSMDKEEEIKEEKEDDADDEFDTPRSIDFPDATSTSSSFAQSIQHFLSSQFRKSSGRYRLILEAANQGCLLLLLDGLDRMKQKHRSHLERWLSHTDAETNWTKRVVVASRFTDVGHAPWTSWTMYRIAPFSTRMQIRLAENLLGRSHSKLPRVKRKLRRGDYAEMASNPLLLTLLVRVLQQEQQEQHEEEDEVFEDSFKSSFLTPSHAAV